MCRGMLWAFEEGQLCSSLPRLVSPQAVKLETPTPPRRPLEKSGKASPCEAPAKIFKLTSLPFSSLDEAETERKIVFIA